MRPIYLLAIFLAWLSFCLWLGRDIKPNLDDPDFGIPETIDWTGFRL
jgi:hypothetical protein